jgi:hypothetical protein
MACLPVRHPQRLSLRLALLKSSNKRAKGGSLLSKSWAAYRNSERRDDCNSRNPRGEFSLYYSGLAPCYLLSPLGITRIDIDQPPGLGRASSLHTVGDAKRCRRSAACVGSKFE